MCRCRASRPGYLFEDISGNAWAPGGPLGNEEDPLFDKEWWSRVEKDARSELRASRRRTKRRTRAVYGDSGPVAGSRRIWRGVVAPAGVLLLIVGAAYFYTVRDRDGGAGGQARTDIAVRPVGPAPVRIDLTHPYRGTPVERYPDGAAGIVLPAARATGTLTAERVAADLAAVKRVLVLSRLDAQMLQRRDPSAYLAALAPNSRAAETKELAAAKYHAPVSELAEGSVLLDAPIKVTGTMTYESTQRDQLTVHTNYVFVYPLRPRDPDALAEQKDLLVMVRAKIDFEVDGEAYRPGDRGVFLSSARGFSHNVDCGLSHRNLLALPGPDSEVLPVDPVDEANVYDPKLPIPEHGNCPP